jgi:hypothetical protein
VAIIKSPLAFRMSKYWDIDIHEIGSHDDRRSVIFMVKVLGIIRAIRLWGHMAEIERPIGISATGVLS